MSQFDKSQLTFPLASPPKAMTVADLAIKLTSLAKIGMGDALVTLPDGREVYVVDLDARDDAPARFILRGPPQL